MPNDLLRSQFIPNNDLTTIFPKYIVTDYLYRSRDGQNQVTLMKQKCLVTDGQCPFWNEIFIICKTFTGIKQTFPVNCIDHVFIINEHLVIRP